MTRSTSAGGVDTCCVPSPSGVEGKRPSSSCSAVRSSPPSPPTMPRSRCVPGRIKNGEEGTG